MAFIEVTPDVYETVFVVINCRQNIHVQFCLIYLILLSKFYLILLSKLSNEAEAAAPKPDKSIVADVNFLSSSASCQVPMLLFFFDVSVAPNYAYIKQNQKHWYLADDDRKFTSAIDLLGFGTAALLLNLLKWSHSTSAHDVQALADVVLIKSLFKTLNF